MKKKIVRTTEIKENVIRRPCRNKIIPTIGIHGKCRIIGIRVPRVCTRLRATFSLHRCVYIRVGGCFNGACCRDLDPLALRLLLAAAAAAVKAPSKRVLVSRCRRVPQWENCTGSLLLKKRKKNERIVVQVQPIALVKEPTFSLSPLTKRHRG